MSFLDWFRARCPTCNRPGIEVVQFLRATVVVDGKRGPAAWSYLSCPHCGGRFRQDVNGPCVVADEEDWLANVERRSKG